MYFIAAGKLEVRHYLEVSPAAICTITLKQHLEEAHHAAEQQHWEPLKPQELYNCISSAGQWRKVTRSDGQGGNATAPSSTHTSITGELVKRAIKQRKGFGSSMVLGLLWLRFVICQSSKWKGFGPSMVLAYLLLCFVICHST